MSFTIDIDRERGAIGVDIGGTKVAAGLVSPEGKISGQVRVTMTSSDGPVAALAAVISAIDFVVDKMKDSGGSHTPIRGIGICSPGPLDPNTGVIINPPNLPCWRNFPLAAEISKRYNLPVKVDNDANAAALAEAIWGSGRGYQNIFYVTVGTGIGTGIIFGGHIYHGRTGAAAEGGHVSVDYKGPLCGCGKRGCIEVLAAGPGIARRTQAKLAENQFPDSLVVGLANNDTERVTSEIVAQAFANGDPLAKEILQETVELLSLWLGNNVDLLEPDAIIIGGGVSSILKPFFDEFRKLVPTFSVNSRANEIPILPAFYGVDSGIAGGAALI